jgi:hydroxylaminobenzene mutase
MQTLLFKLGLTLFVIGLLTGFAIPALKNPRMGLTSHLEGVLNGMFLALGDHEASKVKETVFGFLVVSLSVAVVIGVVIVIVGL